MQSTMSNGTLNFGGNGTPYIVFTGGVTKHALNFQERYSQDGRSTTGHTEALTSMAFMAPPPPPLRLILPFSSRLLPKSRFQMLCH